MTFRPSVVSILTAISLLALVSCSSKEDLPTYVSPGDSLAVGAGSLGPQELGYAPLYRDALERETGHEVRLVRLGIAGRRAVASSESTRTGTRRSRAPSKPSEESQTLRSRSPSGQRPSPVGSRHGRRARAAIARYGRNLDHVLKILKRASDPPPRVTALALYNPAPGSFTDAWTARINR